jgi:hypothetical protein
MYTTITYFRVFITKNIRCPQMLDILELFQSNNSDLLLAT